VPFDHEKLRVYRKALEFARFAKERLASWESRYAVKDHMRRASESVLVNLASGAVRRSPRIKATRFDAALGSTLECAACLDVAHVYGLLPEEASTAGKRTLSAIAGMLVGLRRSTERKVREQECHYGSRPGDNATYALFFHERLDVYRVALEFAGWFHKLLSGGTLSKRLLRELDRATTSMVLNIAEGNGRFSTMDHRRFLEFGRDAAVRAATYLDLAALDAGEGPGHHHEGKQALERVVSMLFRMTGDDANG